ncbi:P-loop containing nucleoside triphosphate hydrolase protein [Chaetomidium leptoderma]|uniref:P-loop containing nucleoside triphosphate hydrolase protein n=1 Tax=Chaetomidium leptoderma TaxID=669021 RepID=A0AAN6VD34_9PEZI|nr:P-loop containing nucleoside triphosphate hydrolase protein [Chaetomidium leptoderma]
MSSSTPSWASAPSPAAATSPAPPAQHKFGVWYNNCVVLGGSSPSGPVFASSKTIGAQMSKIRATAVSSRCMHTNPFLGFTLNFPLPQGQTVNEEAGFGVRYRLNRQVEGGQGLAQAEEHSLCVKFPRGQTVTIEEAAPSLVTRLPGARSLVTVRFNDGAQVKVDGFGMPFKNQEDPDVEGWINRNEPIVEGITLLDFLAQRTFCFVFVASPSTMAKEWDDTRLPPPFSYPYGSEHDWPSDAESRNPDLSRYANLLADTKSPEMFRPAFSYDDDNSHVAVVTQSAVQDEFWLYQAARSIERSSVRAYLADNGQGWYYAILPLPKAFMDKYGDAWRRLAKDNEVYLDFEEQIEGVEPNPQSWLCTIVGHPEQDFRANHSVLDHEVILQCRQPFADREKFVPKTFSTRAAANASQKRSEGNRNGNSGYSAQETQQQDQMDLHRAVMRGQGFYDWMTRPAANVGLIQARASASINEPPTRTARPPPVVNFLAIRDQAYIDALLEEVLPVDRAPFREYMVNRFLGIGIVTAAPGFGKTTLIAVAGLAMEASIGHVLASGPSNVAVDNLALRLDRTSRSVCARYNQDKAQDDPTRARHRLVVRGYTPDLEKDAFFKLLENRDYVPPVSPGKRKNPWTLQLSLACWLLVLLGCPQERFGGLHPDDSEALHGLQAGFNRRLSLRNLCAVATGALTWAEFRAAEDIGNLHENVIGGLMKEILDIANIVAITPAKAPSLSYGGWVRRIAKCVLIDEAANMHRSDVGCLWGNCLNPIFFGGDQNQLPPTVLTGMEKDSDGNLYNRLADDGAISPLSFLMLSGLPVFRLRTQLRMANGLFDWVAEVLYSEVNFTYAPSCAIDRPEFEAGHILERQVRKFPDVRPSPAGKFLPIFVHCEGTKVEVDKRTGSKKCRDQVEVALNIATDLVSEGVDPTKITLLSPYAANVELVRRVRKLPRYANLVAMVDASTVDAFQGQENDIIIVVMATSFPYPGPGFTTDFRRLNVLLTRQRCGLVVVGDVDIKAAGGNNGPRAGWGGRGGRREHAFLVVSPNGERQWKSAPMLQHIHASMIRNGRVVRLNVRD